MSFLQESMDWHCFYLTRLVMAFCHVMDGLMIVPWPMDLRCLEVHLKPGACVGLCFQPLSKPWMCKPPSRGCCHVRWVVPSQVPSGSCSFLLLPPGGDGSTVVTDDGHKGKGIQTCAEMRQISMTTLSCRFRVIDS